ncbi:MAG TPA: methyltransferase domain-containing protein [Pyrinomonadaceae bacterium]|nr:methyltransferase domain-containing protein [Pyrinomonadaceae bacterium]
MNHSEATTTRLPDSPVSIYDRFTNLYDLMFRVNGYRRSMERYLRETPLPLAAGARVLDAGCGTGLLTLALLRVLRRPANVTAVDLSARSLQTARRAVSKLARGSRHKVTFLQADALSLPFADESFDCVVTSGVLEYLPLDKGLAELARVLAPGGQLLFLPVRPSPMSRLLELMFRFKAHPPDEVMRATGRHFTLIEHYRFPPHETIGWTKSIVLAQKQ